MRWVEDAPVSKYVMIKLCILQNLLILINALRTGSCGGLCLVGVAVAKLDIKKILKNFGVLPENTNFGIKTSVVKSLLESSDVNLPRANRREISKSKLGKMISEGTYYLSCWMTMAQIEKMKSRKVIFQNLD